MNEADNIFMKAFRGSSKGTLDRSVRNKIKIGLNALVESGHLKLPSSPKPESVSDYNPEYVKQLQAEVFALRASKPVSGWQPIETAPLDGTDILLAVKDGYPRVMRWSGKCWEHSCISLYIPFDQATHWMPLPSPPKQETENPIQPSPSSK